MHICELVQNFVDSVSVNITLENLLRFVENILVVMSSRSEMSECFVFWNFVDWKADLQQRIANMVADDFSKTSTREGIKEAGQQLYMP